MKLDISNASPTFIRRMGTAAFLILLAKGLLWLAAPPLLVWMS